MLKHWQDAFGHEITDHFKGKGGYEIIERDDGLFSISSGPKLYFLEYEEWPKSEQEAMKYVRGKVLDLGCGDGFVTACIRAQHPDHTFHLLDGSQVDDRVACEIGIFYGLMLEDKQKKGILGFATDARCLRRRDTTYGVNIFTVGTLEEVGRVYEDFDKLVAELKTWDK